MWEYVFLLFTVKSKNQSHMDEIYAQIAYNHMFWLSLLRHFFLHVAHKCIEDGWKLRLFLRIAWGHQQCHWGAGIEIAWYCPFNMFPVVGHGRERSSTYTTIPEWIMLCITQYLLLFNNICLVYTRKGIIWEEVHRFSVVLFGSLPSPSPPLLGQAIYTLDTAWHRGKKE